MESNSCLHLGAFAFVEDNAQNVFDKLMRQPFEKYLVICAVDLDFIGIKNAALELRWCRPYAEYHKLHAQFPIKGYANVIMVMSTLWRGPGNIYGKSY